MRIKKIKLVVERRKIRLSDICTVFFDNGSYFLGVSPRIISVDIPSWLINALGDDDYKVVRNMLDSHSKKIYTCEENTEIHIVI